MKLEYIEFLRNLNGRIYIHIYRYSCTRCATLGDYKRKSDHIGLSIAVCRDMWDLVTHLVRTSHKHGE